MKSNHKYQKLINKYAVSLLLSGSLILTTAFVLRIDSEPVCKSVKHEAQDQQTTPGFMPGILNNVVMLDTGF